MNLYKKQKSSAIIIALVIGAIMSVVMIGSALIISQRIQISAQSRQGKIAYRVALSGIEDGLMLVKQAKARGVLKNVLGANLSGNTLLASSSDQNRLYYDLSISSDAISSFPADFESLSSSQLQTQLLKLGGDNAVSSLGVEQIEEFSKLNVDNTLEINIPEGFSPQSFTVYFSRPHYYDQSTGLPTYYSNYFTPLNIELIDISARAEGQLVYDQTVDSQTQTSVQIDQSKFASCLINHSCKVKIRAQAAKKGTTFDGGGTSSISGKFIYLAVVARDGSGNLLDYSEDRPGTIRISSTGYAGQAVRKLSAELDLTTGEYLGLFDFGVYCGDKCEGRGIDGL